MPSVETAAWKREEATIKYTNVMAKLPTNQKGFDATGLDPVLHLKPFPTAFHHCPSNGGKNQSSPYR